MPRRGRSASPRPAPAPRAPPPPPRQTAPAPTQHAPPPAMAGQPRQPGMMANIASTAAGVAIGHTVGHAMTGALGMGGGHSEAPAPQSQEPQQPYAYQEQQQPYGYQPQQQAPVCQFELKQFMDCTQHQSDLTLCQAFNDALRDCKLRNGLQM